MRNTETHKMESDSPPTKRGCHLSSLSSKTSITSTRPFENQEDPLDLLPQEICLPREAVFGRAGTRQSSNPTRCIILFVNPDKNSKKSCSVLVTNGPCKGLVGSSLSGTLSMLGTVIVNGWMSTSILPHPTRFGLPDHGIVQSLKNRKQNGDSGIPLKQLNQFRTVNKGIGFRNYYPPHVNSFNRWFREWVQDTQKGVTEPFSSRLTKDQTPSMEWIDESDPLFLVERCMEVQQVFSDHVNRKRIETKPRHKKRTKRLKDRRSAGGISENISSSSKVTEIFSLRYCPKNQRFVASVHVTGQCGGSVNSDLPFVLCSAHPALCGNLFQKLLKSNSQHPDLFNFPS